MAERAGDGAPASRASWREPLLAALAAAAIMTAFFLPWMDGSGAFDLRDFSGFDFARLVRNFEITSTTQSSSAQVRGTAVAFYLAPALAVNAAALALAAPWAGFGRRTVRLACGVAGGWTLALHAVVIVMAYVPVSDFAEAVGYPREGTALGVAGAVALVGLGWRAWR